MRAAPFLLGRFGAAYLVTLLAASASVLGALAGAFAPWLDPERLQPFSITPYAYAIGAIQAPNIFIECAFFFSLAAWFRSAMGAYLGAVGLVGLVIMLFANTDQETLATTALFDPFGFGAFRLLTALLDRLRKKPLDSAHQRCRDVEPALSGSVLATALLAFVTARFKLRRENVRKQPRSWRRKSQTIAVSLSAPSPGRSFRAPACRPPDLLEPLALVPLSDTHRSEVRVYRRTFSGADAVRHRHVYGGISGTISQLYGTPVYPLTGALIPVIEGTFSLILLIVVAYYSAEIVHRERDHRIRDVIDATATPGGVIIAAKITTLLLVVVAMILVAMLTGNRISAGAWHDSSATRRLFPGSVPCDGR